MELLKAIKASDVSKVRQLVDAGADLPKAFSADIVLSENLFTPLQFAIKSQASEARSLEIIQIFLDHGADVNARGNPNGPYPLDLACQYAGKATVRYLLKKGAAVNSNNDVLSIAIRRGSKTMVKLLLDHRANVNHRIPHIGKVLALASFESREAMVRLLLSYGADVNLVGPLGMSALSAASSRGHLGIVKCLLNHGADVDLDTELHGTALQCASYHGHQKVVKYLLNNGADVNFEGSISKNALQAASQRGWLKTVKLLVRCGARLNAVSRALGTPIHEACRAGHEHIVRFLLRKGSDITIQHPNLLRQSPLHAAVYSGNLALVQILLDNGAEIHLHAQDISGDTPLHIAVERHYRAIAELLLSRRAPLNVLNALDKSVPQTAIDTHDSFMVLLLHGATVASPMRSPITALDLKEAIGTGDSASLRIREHKDIEIWEKQNGLMQTLAQGAYPFCSKDRHYRHHLPPYEKVLWVLTGSTWPWVSSSSQHYIRMWVKDESDSWKANKSGTINRSILLQIPPDWCLLECCVSFQCYSLSDWIAEDNESEQQSETSLQSFMKCFGVLWTMRKRDSNNIDNGNLLGLRSEAFFSTTQYVQLPVTAESLFLPLLEQIEAGCSENIQCMQERIAQTRSDILRCRGENSLLIQRLLRDAQALDLLRSNGKDIIQTLQDFHRKYYVDDAWGLIHEYSSAVAGNTRMEFIHGIERIRPLLADELDDLADKVQSMIQLEFNLTSISEAQKSTSTNRSLKRLTWITFIFLPLLFIASLFGMNVDVLADNPPWWWYFPLAAGLMILTFGIWIIFKRSNSLEGDLERRFSSALTSIGKRLSRKKNKKHDVENGSPSRTSPSDLRTAAFPSTGKKRS